MTQQIFIEWLYLPNLEQRIPYITDTDILEYMAENDIAYTCHTFPNQTILTDPVVAAQAIADFQIFKDAGVNVWLEIEGILADAGLVQYGWRPGTPVDAYETVLGDCMSMFDAEDEYLIGYGTEMTFDNGFTWMANHAADAGKKTSHRVGWSALEVLPVPNYRELSEDAITTDYCWFTDTGYITRRAQADQWLWEVYTPNSAQMAIAIERWTEENHPEIIKERGITTCPVSQDRADMCQWWSPTLFPPGGWGGPGTVILPIAQQRRIAASWFKAIKLMIGKLDAVEWLQQAPTWAGGSMKSIIEQIQFMQSMDLESDIPVPNMEYLSATCNTVGTELTIPTGWDI